MYSILFNWADNMVEVISIEDAQNQKLLIIVFLKDVTGFISDCFTTLFLFCSFYKLWGKSLGNSFFFFNLD
jgi:hypothetical protein